MTCKYLDRWARWDLLPGLYYSQPSVVLCQSQAQRSLHIAEGFKFPTRKCCNVTTKTTGCKNIEIVVFILSNIDLIATHDVVDKGLPPSAKSLSDFMLGATFGGLLSELTQL